MILVYIYSQTVPLYRNTSVAASLTRCLLLGSKPEWLYVSWTSYPKAIIILSVSEGISFVYHSTYTLSATLNVQFMRSIMPFSVMWQPANFPNRGRAYIYIYIFIHRLTVSLYQNSSVCTDQRDESSWDRIQSVMIMTRTNHVFKGRQKVSSRQRAYRYCYMDALLGR